ncbi:MAG: flagella synthesis protein FlgN [Azovibrio sp.]
MLTFHQILSTELEAVQRFVGLLKREQEILKSTTLENLDELTAEKSRLIEELTNIGQQRNASLVQLGVPENRESIEVWLKQQKNPGLSLAWKNLTLLAQEAKILNELNGQCIALLARNNRQLLDTVTGQKARQILYGPDGQPSNESGSRISDSV